MIYLFIALFVFLLLLLKNDYKNKFVWVFSLAIIGVDIALFSVSLYLLKWSNYISFGNRFGDFDYKFFLWIQNFFSSTIYRNGDITLLGITVYLLSMNLMGLVISKMSLYKRKFHTGFSIALVLYSGIYFLMHLSGFGMKIYIYIYRMNERSFGEKILKSLDYFHNISVLVSLAFPIYLLILLFINSRVTLLKRQYISLILSLLTLNTFFYLSFFVSPIAFSYQTLLRTGFYRNTHFYKENLYIYFTVLPVIMIIATVVNGLLLSKYNLHDTLERVRRYFLQKNLEQYNQQIRGVLHSYKNTLFSIQILAQQESDSNPDNHCVQEILNIAKDNIANISKLLDSLKKIKYNFSSNSLVNTVYKSISEVTIPQNIKIKCSFDDSLNTIYYDEYHIREVLKNLIKNAVESIVIKGNESGLIEISLFQESKWQIIKIHDNGTGIDKKEYKKIFSPYYSTKSKKNNWGIGLSYAKTIIDAHYGYIWAESEKGKSTTFYIMLKGEI